MTIIAFDLGLKVTGVAGDGWSDHHIAPAHLHRSPMTPEREHDRFIWWRDTFEVLLTDHQPTAVWVEAPFIHPKHIGGAMGLIVLHGILRAVTIDHGALFHTVTPSELKRFATGAGNANKTEMMNAARLMGWNGDSHDEADAFLLWHLANTEGDAA